MKIAQVSPDFKKYFNHFRDLFSRVQFHYFSIYLYSLIVLSPDKKSVLAMSQAWLGPVCRSSLQRFLCEVHWEFDKVLQRSRAQLLRVLSQKRQGDRRIQTVIDDSTLEKFGEAIFGVGWYKRHKKDLPFLGLQVVVLGILIDGWLVPLDFRIYVKESDCQWLRLRFETKLQQASEMLRKLRIPRDYQVTVMFDSWYLNEQVTTAIGKRHWFWISRSAKNRSIVWSSGEKGIQLQNYVSQVKWEPLEYTTNRKRPALVGHQRIGTFKKIGRVKVVITSLLADGSDKVAYFCTNRTQLPMIVLVKWFEARWKVEVFFKEARKCFNLGRFQCRDVVSVVHHLCLVLVAAMACACLRLQSQKAEQPFESWGEFVRGLQKQNQRCVLKYFLEQEKAGKYKDFDELCEAMGF